METVFFDEGGVRVTNARIQVPGGKTYAMNGVNSVRIVKIVPSRTGPAVVGGIGLICLISGSFGPAFFFIVFAVIWFLIQGNGEFRVILATSGGEVQALSDKKEAPMQRIVYAINEAIIHRG